MSKALLFSWFPILLGVGIGARLLGQARGFGLGALAALFWIVLAQAESGLVIWRDAWQVAALGAGALVLVMMGGWSGQNDAQQEAQAQSHEGTMGERLSGSLPARFRASMDQEDAARWQKVAAAAEQFEDWLARHAGERSPWPKFADFLRSVLYECCLATHVKCFRWVESAQQLQCLEGSANSCSIVETSPPGPLVEQVFSTGRSFTADGVGGQGSLAPGVEVAVAPVAASAPAVHRSPSWCFAIEGGGHRVGVVSVGQMGSTRFSSQYVAAIEKLVGMFWLHLVEVHINRIAGDEDPVSGLLNRPTFLRSSDAALRECYEQGEPVALAVVGVQGLRQLNDCGRWEVADELIQEIGHQLQARARLDDRIGRFDGSRFMWLLRRVDVELASLILKHMMGRLGQVCGSTRWGVPVIAYCGFSGSGTGKPDLRRLLTSALQQAQRARMEGVPLAFDHACEIKRMPALVEAGT